MKDSKNKSFFVATVGIFTALSLALSFLESLIPANFLPLGAKPGLSNIAVMFSASALGTIPSIFIVIIKSAFAGLTRGTVAGFLSLCGGLLSVLTMILFFRFSKKTSILLISVFSAVAHNLGQFIGAYFITGTPSMIYYLPLLLIYGIFFGIITGTILKIILPYLNKLRSKIQ
jgi:heptaprenyl diphosphate synthase